MKWKHSKNKRQYAFLKGSFRIVPFVDKLWWNCAVNNFPFYIQILCKVSEMWWDGDKDITSIMNNFPMIAYDVITFSDWIAFF